MYQTQSDNIKAIIKNIKKEIDIYNKANERYNNEKLDGLRNGAPYDPFEEEKIEVYGDECKKRVTELIKKLRVLSLKEDYYFYDCPFKVYQKNYQLLKFLFLVKNIDGDESDFIKDELINHLENYNTRDLRYNDTSINYDKHLNYVDDIVFSNTKKTNFLKDKLYKLGWDSYIIEDDDGEPFYYNFIENENIGSDADDTMLLNSGEIEDVIVVKIEAYTNFKETVIEYIRHNRDNNKEDFDVLDYYQAEYEGQCTKTKNIISKLIADLYYKSSSEGYYFFDCPIDAYKATISKRYEDYKKVILDGEINDFLKTELNVLKSPDQNRFFLKNGTKVYYHLFLEKITKQSGVTINKKIKFLNETSNVILNTTDRKSTSLTEILNISKKTGNQLQQNKFEASSSKDRDDIKKNVEQRFSKDIFISNEAEQWFKDTLDELNALDSKGKAQKRGFQAKANAIWSNYNVKNNLFKYGLTLKQYIEYLNKYFDAEIKNKDKLSKPDNHTNRVSELYKAFKNKASE